MLLSVIVPCYNKEKSVHITMDALLAQTVINYMEIIIINDCSSDNTLQILEKYKRDNPNVRITIVNQSSNMGIFAARVIGTNMSKGLFVAMIDADDWCDKTYYEDMLFEALPDTVAKETFLDMKQKGVLHKLFNKYYKQCVDIVYNCNVVKYYSPDKQYDGKESIVNSHPYGTYLIDPGNKVLRKIFIKNWHIVWNKLFKRDVIVNITYLPLYRIDIFEDILISFVCYMNALYIKVVNTNGKIYYNLSEDVEHLTNKITSKEKKRKTAASTTTVFLTISALITEYNKYEWLEVIRKYRQFYITAYTKKLKNSFKERFDNDFVGIDRNGFNHSQSFFDRSYDDVESFIGTTNIASLASPTQMMIDNERDRCMTRLECLQSVNI